MGLRNSGEGFLSIQFMVFAICTCHSICECRLEHSRTAVLHRLRRRNDGWFQIGCLNTMALFVFLFVFVSDGFCATQLWRVFVCCGCFVCLDTSAMQNIATRDDERMIGTCNYSQCSNGREINTQLVGAVVPFLCFSINISAPSMNSRLIHFSYFPVNFTTNERMPSLSVIITASLIEIISGENHTMITIPIAQTPRHRSKWNLCATVVLLQKFFDWIHMNSYQQQTTATAAH